MTIKIEEIKRGKLTKKFLMGLPDNVFLVSNIFPTRYVSAFAEKITPLAKRIYQWQRIKEASVDQRLCYVFKTKKDFERWLKQPNYYLEKLQ